MKNNFSAYLLNAEIQFNGLSKALKIVVLIASLLIVFLMWQYFAFTVLEKTQSANIKIDFAQKEMNALSKLVAQIKQQKSGDWWANLTKQKETLSQQLQTMEANLSKHQASVISDKELFVVLKKVVGSHPMVEMSNFRHLPKKKLLTIHQGVLYENPFEITITGDFNSIYTYLKKMEGAKLNLYWDEMGYTVQKYPEASVRVYFHIITLEKG